MVNRRQLLAAAGAGLVAVATGAGPAAAATVGPIPRSVIDRYGLDTRWYGKYVDAWGLPVLGPAYLQDATLLRVQAQLGTLLWTYPSWPVTELARRDVRVVVVARGERMSAVPEVRQRFGTTMDDRYWAGFGATDAFPLSASTESNVLDGQGGENVFVHEFGHTLHLMALRHVDPAFQPELTRAFDAARRAGLWTNTYAGSNVEEYFAEGIQSYFGVNYRGPAGGDGVHNNVSTRAALLAYDRPLFALLDRVYRGTSLPVG
ncbi:hypothetical protein OWR29_37610 [Actinoplanes sp. Pm04-4]|uniref:Uncharacterized protein n=1 Tax=Paractinoplanes pyxinae TaxID=2997416 RepID=A0ABT4BB58_9ACTN|nr:hypothetical protein [Actinoplanes pyxinae]MCY1143751.1 hypothetical protein [Actinoplanes pyxinae]